MLFKAFLTVFSYILMKLFRVVDIVSSASLNIFLYFFNAIQPAFADLLPEVSNNNPTISGMVSVIVGALIFISQVACRIYLSYKSSDQITKQSNELLSNKSLFVQVVIRIILVVFGKVVGLPVYFYNFVFLAGMVFMPPLVIVCNHPGARNYFLQRNPRIKKMMKPFQDYLDKSGSTEEIKLSKVTLEKTKTVEVQKRGRSNSLPNDINTCPTHPKIGRTSSVPKDLEKPNTLNGSVLEVVNKKRCQNSRRTSNPQRFKMVDSRQMPTIEN